MTKDKGLKCLNKSHWTSTWIVGGVTCIQTIMQLDRYHFKSEISHIRLAKLQSKVTAICTE